MYAMSLSIVQAQCRTVECIVYCSTDLVGIRGEMLCASQYVEL